MTMLIAAAACGGGASTPAATSCVRSSAVSADVRRSDATTAVAIAARDDRFEPDCIELDAPGPVTIVLRNEGRHPHNLILSARDRVAVDAGQVAILEAVVESTGMQFTCTIHPGMDGEIRVAD